MKIVVVLLILAGVSVLLLFLFRRVQRTDTGSLEGHFISTSSETDARAARLLPERGSEDRSDLLKTPDLPAAAAGERDYRPDPNVDWSVTAKFRGVPDLKTSELLKLFDKEWLQANGHPELYGKAAQDGHWTFLLAGDAPELHTELAFGWRLISSPEESAPPPSAATLASRGDALRARLSRIGSPDLLPSSAPETAAQTAIRLAELKTTCDRTATIILKAPPGRTFEGRQIWDVMMSLGLKWGDMDIFHWVNTSEIGDDSFFGVWTSTSPGYFFPEEIAAGRVHTEDLVFGFSIPRCAAPQSVFSSMVSASQYAQQRLGGKLVDGDNRELDVRAVQAEIAAIEQRLTAAGFQPGRGSALYIF